MYKKIVDPLEHISMRKAAMLSGISYVALWRAVKDGKVSAPAHAIGAKNYYRPDELKDIRRQFAATRGK